VTLTQQAGPGLSGAPEGVGPVRHRHQRRGSQPEGEAGECPGL